jgi:hypothetical protein
MGWLCILVQIRNRPTIGQLGGSRLEIMLRELGGVIWIQIASAIVLLRLHCRLATRCAVSVFGQ